MERNYYFFATALPPLQIGVPPEMGFQEFDTLAKINLSPEDYHQLVIMRRMYDLLNVRSFWRGEPLSYRGNYNEKDLEDALVTREGLPGYVYDFMDRYDTLEDRLRHFTFIMASYFANEIPNTEGFLFHYLVFERNMRLVLTALRAKKLKRDVLAELQYEDVSDDIVAQILAQKDAGSYEPPEEFTEIKVIFDEFSDSPLQLQEALDQYRFTKIQEMIGLDMFSLAKILAYAAQLIIVEKGLELDMKKGMELVESIIKDVS